MSLRVVCISDTHTFHDQVTLPEGDVLLHAGDLCIGGNLGELRSACDWLNKQVGRFDHVIAIAGNHDFACEHFMNSGEEDMLRRDFFRDVIYLRDNAVAIKNRKFYGSPWQPWFQNWAFNLQRGREIKEKWDLIPVNTDVLVTHGPPYGVRDWVGRESVGCEELIQRVAFVQPALHVFGHIHSGHGVQGVGETKFVNASVVNEAYKVAYEPIVVDIP